MAKASEITKSSLEIRRAILKFMDGKKLTLREMHKYMNLTMGIYTFRYHVEVLYDGNYLKWAGKFNNSIIFAGDKTEYMPQLGDVKPLDLTEPVNLEPVVEDTPIWLTVVSCNKYHTKGRVNQRSAWERPSMVVA